MGLSISVGILADLQKHDPEMVEELELEFDKVNDVLTEHGFPNHSEPREVPAWSDPLKLGGFPYSWIHYLRRYAGHRLAFPERVPPVLQGGQKPTDDPILERMMSRESHLLWHSDCEGFYIPVDFSQVLEDDRILGGALGSSQRLLTELRSLAEPLGFSLEGDWVSPDELARVEKALEKETPLFIERATWLTLFDAAKVSIAFKTAIYFG